MDYQIRSARPEEFDLLPAIERSASRRFATIVGLDDLADDDELDTPDIIAAAARCGAVFVAANSAQPVGFLIAGFLDRALFIYELAVLEDHGRRGLGSALVKEACQFALRERQPGVTLSTFIEVPWNGPFYERLGFSCLRREEWTPGLHLIYLRERDKNLPMDRRSFMRKEIA
jgi:GNAT superfamily N-acetyltransferase